MPDLPARPDLDQLRHQAKDLLHAAQNSAVLSHPAPKASIAGGA